MSKEKILAHFADLPVGHAVQSEARSVINNGLEFPTLRDEKWKYTKITSILSSDYSRSEAKIEAAQIAKQKAGNSCSVVFVNGLFQPSLSDSLPAGVEFKSMRGSAEIPLLGQIADYKNEAFVSLNTSFFEDGACISVTKNCTVETPICIINLATGSSQASNIRNLVHVQQGGEATFIHRFEGQDSAGSMTNSVIEIFVEEGANVNYYVVEDEGDDTSSIHATYVSQEKASEFSIFTATKSGKLVRNNIHASIKGEGCETNMYGLYFTDGKQHVDNQTYADHQQANCNSNELYKGVMNGRSTGVFNGKIMVHQAAQQTNAFQSNQNILLSDNATINTKPELEIYADDVKCSHGCTIGQLDEEALFYLRSRGLGKEAANRLLVQAFAADVTEKIDLESLRHEIEQFVESKFA